MRKGHVFLGLGVALILISIPTAFAYTLYESKEVPKHQFQEGYYDEGEFSYEFKDIGPGKLTIEGSSAILSSDTIIITLRDRTGAVVRNTELGVSGIFSSKKEIEVRESGDYTIHIKIEEDPESTDFTVTYTGEYSNVGLMIFIIGFPLFLISGLTLMTLGIVFMIRFNRTGSERSPRRDDDELYSLELESHYGEKEPPLERETDRLHRKYLEEEGGSENKKSSKGGPRKEKAGSKKGLRSKKNRSRSKRTKNVRAGSISKRKEGPEE